MMITLLASANAKMWGLELGTKRYTICYYDVWNDIQYDSFPMPFNVSAEIFLENSSLNSKESFKIAFDKMLPQFNYRLDQIAFVLPRNLSLIGKINTYNSLISIGVKNVNLFEYNIVYNNPEHNDRYTFLYPEGTNIRGDTWDFNITNESMLITAFVDQFIVNGRNIDEEIHDREINLSKLIMVGDELKRLYPDLKEQHWDRPHYNLYSAFRQLGVNNGLSLSIKSGIVQNPSEIKIFIGNNLLTRSSKINYKNSSMNSSLRIECDEFSNNVTGIEILQNSDIDDELKQKIIQNTENVTFSVLLMPYSNRGVSDVTDISLNGNLTVTPEFMAYIKTVYPKIKTDKDIIYLNGINGVSTLYGFLKLNLNNTVENKSAVANETFKCSNLISEVEKFSEQLNFDPLYHNLISQENMLLLKVSLDQLLESKCENDPSEFNNQFNAITSEIRGLHDEAINISIQIQKLRGVMNQIDQKAEEKGTNYTGFVETMANAKEIETRYFNRTRNQPIGMNVNEVIDATKRCDDLLKEMSTVSIKLGNGLDITEILKRLGIQFSQQPTIEVKTVQSKIQKYENVSKELDLKWEKYKAEKRNLTSQIEDLRQQRKDNTYKLEEAEKMLSILKNTSSLDTNRAISLLNLSIIKYNESDVKLATSTYDDAFKIIQKSFTRIGEQKVKIINLEKSIVEISSKLQALQERLNAAEEEFLNDLQELLKQFNIFMKREKRDHLIKVEELVRIVNEYKELFE